MIKNVLQHQDIRLAGAKSGEDHPGMLKLVRYWDEINDNELVFLPYPLCKQQKCIARKIQNNDQEALPANLADPFLLAMQEAQYQGAHHQHG